MTIPIRCQQTEVGVIPSDWGVRKCSSLSKLITVGIVIRPTQYYVEHGIPALRSANVREAGVDDSDMVHISEKANSLLAKSQLRRNDIVTVRTGYPGTSAVVPERFAGANCIDILITRPKAGVNPNFLAAWINSPHGKSQVLRKQGGLAQKHFNVGDMRELLVALPSSEAEQQAIAEALGDADAWIESLQGLIAKNRHLKQAAMQQLLTGKTRLPRFEGEWETKRLGEIGEVLIGLTYTPSDVAEHGTLVLRASNIQENTIVFQDDVYVSMEVPERTLVKSGDILICVRNGSRDLIGKCAMIDQRSEEQGHAFGAFMAVFRTEYHDFVFHQFQSDLMKRQIHEHLGATINQITNKSLNSFKVPFPAMSEQIAIAQVLTDMNNEIAALEVKLAKARDIKQGMMQQLLTGKIRLV